MSSFMEGARLNSKQERREKITKISSWLPPFFSKLREKPKAKGVRGTHIN
jgi:hypothetical protein